MNFKDYMDAKEFRKTFPVTCWLLEKIPEFAREFEKLDAAFEENALENFKWRLENGKPSREQIDALAKQMTEMGIPLSKYPVILCSPAEAES